MSARPRFQAGDRVEVTGDDGRVYDAVVCYGYTVARGGSAAATRYAVQIPELGDDVYHAAADRVGPRRSGRRGPTQPRQSR
jgi:hypothetical protein